MLAAAVNERLKLRWSPHAAAADLREAGMSVCAETIYRACYANDARSGLPAGTWAKLPRRARRRRPRSVAQAQKPSPLGEYRPTADRPADVEDRTEPGHCEGDLIVGKANLTAAVTLAERTSRYTVTAALPDGYGAPQAAAAAAAALGRQPAALVRSLTWDQGREMARWADVEAALGIEVFFCEPRSPWQRPTNEHTNALMRRWLPKGTSLDIGQLRLSVIEDNLNHMPRRLHHWHISRTTSTLNSLATTGRACRTSQGDSFVVTALVDDGAVDLVACEHEIAVQGVGVGGEAIDSTG